MELEFLDSLSQGTEVTEERISPVPNAPDVQLGSGPKEPIGQSACDNQSHYPKEGGPGQPRKVDPAPDEGCSVHHQRRKRLNSEREGRDIVGENRQDAGNPDALQVAEGGTDDTPTQPV